MSKAQWYVAHTYSGYENKVKLNIEKNIENRGLQDQILEVRVPMQSVIELKNGVEKLADKKLFPGYVLVHMVMNDETWYVVRNTRGVTGFVGPGSKAVPLTPGEIENLGFVSVSSDSNQERLLIDFSPGDSVTVIGGAWKGTAGIITEINDAKKTVAINVDMFGRSTKVELGFSEIRRI